MKTTILTVLLLLTPCIAFADGELLPFGGSVVTTTSTSSINLGSLPGFTAIYSGSTSPYEDPDVLAAYAAVGIDADYLLWNETSTATPEVHVLFDAVPSVDALKDFDSLT